MFRRGIDFSWPLIVILAGFFFVSLQIPRQWERIARPTCLQLSAKKLPAAVDSPVSKGRQDEISSPDAFHPIRPAERVAGNAGTPVDPTLPAPSSEFATSAVNVSATEVVSTATPEMSGPKIITVAAPLIEPATPAQVAVDPQLPLNQNASLPANVATAHTDAARPPANSNDFGSEESEAAGKVRVLRDVALTDAAHIAVDNRTPQGQPSESPKPVEAGVLRLPALANGSTQSPVSESVSSATPNTLAAENFANPLRSIAPEPELPAAENAVTQPTNPLPVPSKPELPQPSSTATAEAAKSQANSLPTEQGKPANKVAEATSPASESAANESPRKALGGGWVEPSQLMLQLDDLSKHEATRAWASEVAADIRKLGPAISAGTPETTEILQHLELLTRRSPTLLLKVNDDVAAQKLSRTSHALLRHVNVWNQIGKMGGMAAADVPLPAVDPREINKCLSEIDQLTGNSTEGHAWRKYLLIESLHDWAARRRGDERLPHDLAQQVLSRLNPMSVSSHQRQFLTTGPMADLHQEVLRHAAEPVESNRLLRHLENYEASGLSSDARLLARDCQFLSVGSGAAPRELGDQIEMHWRNANLRIAVTAELLNRIMPKREPEYAAVNDNIQGYPVRGQSLMASEVTVRLIPDPHRVLLALEVNGEVASLTRSTAGPATFFSDNESSYIARKPMDITLRGISTGKTQVAVDNSSKLRGISTSFDGVPILGRVVNNAALSQQSQKMPAADAEVRGKIAARAKERIDHETSDQIAQATHLLNDEVIGPMDALMLDPMLVAAETTDKRFSMRIRLAGPDQLGGHTPRPQAPADSLASVQIHESMINNVLDRLELDGQTFDLAGLGKRLAERLHRFQPKPIDPDQEDVKITFAANDALHVRCDDGRVEISLSIARLSKGTRKWKDFRVRAFYRPVVQGRSVDLAREGVVQLMGPRMSVTSQIALRGVFSKVFSQKEPIHVSPESFVKNPKLNGIVVTQLVIDDGWIGAAIGPQRIVTAQLRKFIR
jgi:hypothetical protein